MCLLTLDSFTHAKRELFASYFLQVALRAFEMLSPIYTYVFLFVRSVVAPPVVVWFAMTLMAATKLPFACRYVHHCCLEKLHAKPCITVTCNHSCVTFDMICLLV